MTDVEKLLERLEKAYGDEGPVRFEHPSQKPDLSQPVIITDVSDRGARLSAEGLLGQDARIFLRAHEFEVEGRVAWSIGTACGIEFREPLSPSCFASLERRGVKGQIIRI